jgi:hypothetical protein
VADGAAQGSDPDFTTPGAPLWPFAAPSAEDHAAVLAACGVPALPADDVMMAPVLVFWHRNAGLVDLHPRWSVHDGTGRWLGTFVLEVLGSTPRDRHVVLRGGPATITVASARPEAVARITDADGRVLASVRNEGTVQRLAGEVDGMTVAHATYSVGEVPVTDAAGNAVARLVPPPLALRRSVGKRVGWQPSLVAEQVAVADPVTARGVNALALGWEHVLREWVD